MPIRLLTPVRSRDEGTVLYIYNDYYKMFHKMDAELIIITPASLQTYLSLADMCDGLLLTGGIDVNPKYYNQEKHVTTNIEIPALEQMEFKLIELFANQKKPILGICRGIQTINVFFNGTLLQDINSQYIHVDLQVHEQKEKTGYSHQVTIQEGSLLSKYLDSKISVNSFHHQNIDLLAPGFIASAISDDGLIEGIERGNIVALQWHPEKTADENQDSIIKAWRTLF